jgi:hypothetical protein
MLLPPVFLRAEAASCPEAAALVAAEAEKGLERYEGNERLRAFRPRCRRSPFPKGGINVQRCADEFATPAQACQSFFSGSWTFF